MIPLSLTNCYFFLTNKSVSLQKCIITFSAQIKEYIQQYMFITYIFFCLGKILIYFSNTIKAEPKDVLSTTLYRFQAISGPFIPLFTLQLHLQLLPTNSWQSSSFADLIKLLFKFVGMVMIKINVAGYLHSKLIKVANIIFLTS